jgi:outer membrane protein
MSKVLLGIIGALAIASLGWHIYDFEHRTEVVFVSVPEVFNGFDMKKEMEKKFEATSEQRKLILDSLKFNFNQRFATEEPSSLESLKREILFKEQQFEEGNAATLQDYNQQVLTQLNVYMKEFGEQHEYDIILGAQGTGSLIYAEQEKNVTAEMIEFVNARYRGIE